LKKVLIIDDDEAVLNYLKVLLLQMGKYDVKTLSDSRLAYKELENNDYDLLLLDMDMPEVTGLDILRYANSNGIESQVIVLTGVEVVELAVSAMKSGAFDYLTKPVEADILMEKMDRALEQKELREAPFEKKIVNRGLKFKEAFSEIVTNDPGMNSIFQIVEKIAISDTSVLVWGESGTGKELVARAIHKISKRRDQKFIAVNAGVFASELFSSEFFGHEKGAFSGAIASKKGFIEEANDGTLFLDEIGELSLPVQVKLLRVLQEGEFFRLGSTKNFKANVRIIAATNKNLHEEVKRGSFRKDLFYRLNINSIYLPPLRERKGDIQLLAYHFINQFGKSNNKKIAGISEQVLKLLKSYDYPGNVRELMNIINSAVIVEPGSTLSKRSLPQYFLDNAFAVDAPGIERKTLSEVEKEHIQKILKLTSGNKTKAAKILGISRVNLIAKLKQY